MGLGTVFESFDGKVNLHPSSDVFFSQKFYFIRKITTLRVVMKNLSDFFRTTAVSKLEISEADQVPEF